ncbi:glutamate racemase [Croceicoccus bisphenolivorans]|uniref:glutamate racemase n=1 Tax=Croceicoccus bisphenolivorans TaxID=1783232 RepID=UPI00082A5E43|nr:glutamate racemase [Croceicoccus bisphenolivorans]
MSDQDASPDPDAPILIFDSGVGGLSVLDAVRALMPDAPLIYAADTAGLPYGSKSEAEIAARVAGLLGRMSERFRPRLACIACNTASTIALGMVREVLHIPIVGTVPAIKPAAALTKTGTIGLIGTEATIRQAYVDNLEAEFAQGKTLLRLAAPDLVAAAEAKLRGDPVDLGAIRKAAEDLTMMASGNTIDVLVLACTHFPLLSGELREVFGSEVELVDGAAGIARRIAQLTQGQSFARSIPDRAVFTSADARLDALRPALGARGIEDILVL